MPVLFSTTALQISVFRYVSIASRNILRAMKMSPRSSSVSSFLGAAGCCPSALPAPAAPGISAATAPSIPHEWPHETIIASPTDNPSHREILLKYSSDPAPEPLLRLGCGGRGGRRRRGFLRCVRARGAAARSTGGGPVRAACPGLPRLGRIPTRDQRPAVAPVQPAVVSR